MTKIFLFSRANFHLLLSPATSLEYYVYCIIQTYIFSFLSYYYIIVLFRFWLFSFLSFLCHTNKLLQMIIDSFFPILISSVVFFSSLLLLLHPISLLYSVPSHSYSLLLLLFSVLLTQDKLYKRNCL